MTVRYALAVAANVGAVGVALAGSTWLWVRASESSLPASLGQTLPPALEDVQVPFTPDPRVGTPFSRRVVVGAQPPRPRPDPTTAPARRKAVPKRSPATGRTVTTVVRPTSIKRVARPTTPVTPPPAPTPPPPSPSPPPPASPLLPPPAAPPPPTPTPPPAPAPVLPAPPLVDDPGSVDGDTRGCGHKVKKHKERKKEKRSKCPPAAPAPAPPPPAIPAPPVDPGDNDHHDHGKHKGWDKKHEKQDR